MAGHVLASRVNAATERGNKRTAAVGRWRAEYKERCSIPTLKRRTKSPLFEKRHCSKGRHRQEQLDIQRSRRVKTEASEFRDVIHYVVVFEISQDVLVKTPAVGINKGCQQTRQGGNS